MGPGTGTAHHRRLIFSSNSSFKLPPDSSVAYDLSGSVLLTTKRCSFSSIRTVSETIDIAMARDYSALGLICRVHRYNVRSF